MPNEPQDRSADVGVQLAGLGDRTDRTTPEEVREPARKRDVADKEWLSMATPDPAHFLKDLRSE